MAADSRSQETSPEPHAPSLAFPPGIDPQGSRAKAIDTFNQAALLFATRIGTDDEKARSTRWTTVIALAGALVVGTFVIIGLIVTQDDLGTAIVGVTAVVAVLGVAGFVNPLQTIERDIVYRRWSDVITASFFLQVGDYQATPKDVRRATQQATAGFAALAGSYGRMSARTLEAIETAASTAAEPEEEDGDEADGEDGARQAATAISVTNPGKQESTVGTAVEGFTLVAAGPGDLVFAAAGLPKGIVVDPGTGAFSGTPAEATPKAGVEVTVTSTAADTGRATVGFTWVVTGPDEKPPGKPPAEKAVADKPPAETPVRKPPVRARRLTQPTRGAAPAVAESAVGSPALAEPTVAEPGGPEPTAPGPGVSR